MPLVSSAPQPSLKQHVYACLTRLADRDTYSAAAAELESIARGLDAAAEVAPFVSCIHSTDASDRSPARRHCVKLLSVLADSHGDALAPHLNKILSAVVRRLRDPDSGVRAACVSAVESLRRRVGKPPFAAFLKPLADALFTEQDQNSQIGAALCLAAAVESEASTACAAERMAKLMPRLERLLRFEGFKAKPAVLSLVGSAIGAGAVAAGGGEAALRSLVPCLAQILSSEDWAARKAAAEALAKLAVVESESLSEYKAVNLKIFESRRYDKVKAVREVMNQMLETRKRIPDVSGDISSPPRSIDSSKEKVSDGRYPPGSRNSVAAGLEARRKSRLPMRSTPPDSSYATTARKRTPLKGSEPKVLKDDCEEGDENVPDKRVSEKILSSKPETKRALFNKHSNEKVHKHGGFRSGSRVAPLNDESRCSSLVSNVTEDIQKNHVECEDLALIRNQLVQIEKQQSSLMDLLQRFIGSSQNGMRSLETRVHGLELALDEISYDLAVSSGRLSKTESSRTMCWPGADFLSSKFWRRSETRMVAPRISTPSIAPSVVAMRFRDDGNSGSERFKLSRRFRLQGGGLIVNPLADMQSISRGNSSVANQ